MNRISPHLAKFEHIKSRRGFDFESAFTTVAVKSGSSEIVHIDGNDKGITWVLPLGNWKGAHLVIPQLGLKIAMKPGQVIGMCANILAHYTTPITEGERIAITMFTCSNVFNDAQKIVK